MLAARRCVHAGKALRKAARVALLPLLLAFSASAGELSLALKPAPDDFAASLAPGDDPELSSRPGHLAAIGTISVPEFAVKSPKSVKVLDANGKSLDVLTDKSSYYSEFGDGALNSLKLEFFIAEDALSAGPPKIVWGDGVDNPSVKELPALAPKAGSLRLYRSFSALASQGGGPEGSSKVATIQVLVDDYADKYFWWYLLPLALLAGAVVFRRLKAK